MLESRLEANLGRCWAWSSKPVVRHFVSRVGSTPTSFRHYFPTKCSTSRLFSWQMYSINSPFSMIG
jgi:hypothetical protein